MISDANQVFLLIGAAGLMMASNRFRFDVVAMLVVLALMLTGILTIEEAISGFGSPVVILVAGLFVIGDMLSRTGVAKSVGDLILRHGGNSETRLLALIMISAATIGAFASSTVVVALLIPVVLRVCAETNLNASRMLIPMSYASLISGMQTLISTAPNIVVHEALKDAGYNGFNFFSFTPVGLSVLGVCILYILLVGRRLLGKKAGESNSTKMVNRTVEDLWLEHAPGSSYRLLQVTSDSELVGLSLADSQLETRYKVRIAGIFRKNMKGKKRVAAPSPEVEITKGATLLALGNPANIDQMARENHLPVLPPEQSDPQRWLWDISGATILIHPDSQLSGKSLRECEFRSSYGVHVLGIRRNFSPLKDYEDANLQTGDSLFVVGHWSKIQQLSQKLHDFVVMELPREHENIVPSYDRLGLSLLIVLAMVLLTLFNIVPLIPAVLMAVFAAITSRCLTVEEAYRSINWSALVLIGGMLPLAQALNKTGGIQMVSDALMTLSSGSGPYMLMTLVFFLTASIGLVLSNTASAVLVSPIAIYAATAFGVSPYPFAVAVVIAASSAFSTPVATPVVTLVVEPGRYRFGDFLKTGLPLLALTYLTTLLVAPWIFPFYPNAG